MLFEEFQDGCNGNNLGYRNGTILAILNLYVIPILLIKFRLSLTYSLKNFKMAAMNWISECNDFINSESLCHSNASHQVSAQSSLRF